MSDARSPAAEYLRFLAWSVGVGAALVVLGYAPTKRLGGEDALPAMIAGCVIGVLASAAGAVPVALGRRPGARTAPLQGMLASMVARLAAVLVLGLAVGLAGWFEARPLLLWIGLGYMAQLALDVWYVVRGV
ncbi:MAG TPA: hypothetical protein VIC28_02785 [Thermoanaerobaculia bacterium]|jgi:hypothetical protein